MTWTSELGTLVLFVLVAGAAWWLAGTHGVRFLRRRQVKGRRKSAPNPSGSQDHDLVLVQPFDPWRVAAAALGWSVVLFFLVTTFLYAKARHHYGQSLRIVPAVIAETKLEADFSECSREDGLSPLERTLFKGFESLGEGREDGFASTFLQELLKEKDLSLQGNKDVSTLLKNWITYESECGEKPKSAPTILSDLLSEKNLSLPTSTEGDSNPRGDLESWLRESLVPRSLESREARGFFGSPYPGSDGEQTSMAHELGRNPELRVLYYALYEKIREQLRGHRRVRDRLVGLIQFMTLWLFFFALILLRGRRLLTNDPEAMTKRLGRLSKETLERIEHRLDRVEYSAVSFATYAMPTLGFVGTVYGIGRALGSADLVVRAGDALQQANAISAVTSVLGVAFDTTLVALICSLPITLLTSWTRSDESRLLLETQRPTSTDLPSTGSGKDS